MRLGFGVSGVVQGLGFRALGFNYLFRVQGFWDLYSTQPHSQPQGPKGSALGV